MINEINKIEEFLKEDPNRAIDILDDRQSKITNKLTSSEVESKGGVFAILTGISQDMPSLKMVAVRLNTPNGRSAAGYPSYKIKETYEITFTKKQSLGSDLAPAQSTVAANAAVPPGLFPQQNIPQTMQSNLPLGNLTGMNGGMNAAMFQYKAIDYERILAELKEAKATHQREIDKLEKKYEKNEEKSEKKYEKQIAKQEKIIDRLENTIDRLDLELREAKSKIANFVEKLDLEKRLIEAGVKKTDVAEVIGKLAPMLQSLMPMIAGGNPAQPQAMAGAASLSSTKDSLVSVIVQEDFSDEQALYVYNIINLMSNEAFRTQLTALMQQHNH